MNRRMRRAGRLFCGGLLMAVVFAGGARAQDGRLDPAFGDRGQVTMSQVSYPRMAVGRDGTIAVLSRLGKSGVRRYLPDGKPDPSFGRSGRLVLPKLIEGLPYETADVALDRRGRVLLFGSAFPQGHPPITIYASDPFGESVPISRAMVARLQGDGRLDPSFGGGRGTVVSDFGLQSEVPQPEDNAEPTTRVLAGAVDSRNRPVLLAGVAGRYSPCLGHSGYASFPRGIVRLTSAGALDPGFGGGDGVSSMLQNFNTSPAPDLTLTATDQPLAAGSVGSVCPASTLVFRLDAAGEPLPGFGAKGSRNYLYKRFGRFGVFAPSGAVILRQWSAFSIRMIRVTPKGSIDRSFGVNGFAAVEVPRGTNRTLRPAAVDSQGRILMLGSYSRPAADPRRKQAFIGVERLLPSGEPDLGFGRGGVISAPVPAAQILGGNRAALDGRGRLVVLSEVNRPSGKANVAAVLARFRLDG